MMLGKWPAVLVSYDGASRTAQVAIPGMTDGGDTTLTAQLEYSLGDHSDFTEYRLLDNALVWVEFLGGDSRRPIITGYRNPQVGNEVGWRRWSQANFETNADAEYHVNAGSHIVLHVGGTTLTIADGQVTVDATQATFTGAVTVQGLFTFESGMQGSGGGGGGATMSITGNTSFNGQVSANGKRIDDSHTHTSTAPGTPTSTVN